MKTKFSINLFFPAPGSRFPALSSFPVRSYRLFVLAFFLALGAWFRAPAALAEVPKLMTYQGLLKDSAGHLLSGDYFMTFKIYTVPSGGTAAWSETQSSVSVSSGKFSVQLGSVTPLNLDFSSDYWLGITIGADSEMLPRIRLTSVGYGIRSDYENNGFTQSAHAALSHKDIEGVKDNTVNLAKTNFKFDAYALAAANNMGSLIIDVFSDASGIDSRASSGYVWRDASDYDVVTAPAGIDSYVVLALHANATDGSTALADSSRNPKTFTAYSGAQIDTAQSKFGGASALFTGGGSRFSTPDHHDLELGSGDFTIDFWVRLSALGGSQVMCGKSVLGGSSNSFYIYATHSGTVKFYIFDSSQNIYGPTSTSTLGAGTWYHIAGVRSGDNLKLFINGIQAGSAGAGGVSIADLTGPFSVGSSGDMTTSTLNGWMDEFRLSKGIARWSSDFTPPSSEYRSSGTMATVISNAYPEPAVPAEAMVIADETLNTGSIAYYISRDNGITWTQVTKETVTSIRSQPSGTQLKWKALIHGDAELDSIAVAV